MGMKGLWVGALQCVHGMKGLGVGTLECVHGCEGVRDWG